MTLMDSGDNLVMLMRGEHRKIPVTMLVPGHVLAFAHRVVLEVTRIDSDLYSVKAARPGSDEPEWEYRWSGSVTVIVLAA